MKRLLGAVALIICVLTLSGCGSSPGESLMNDMVQCLNEMAEAMEKKLPQDQLAAIQTRMKEIGEKLEALKLSEEDKKKLLEKHRDAMTKAGERMQKAMVSQVGNLGNMIPGLPKTGP